MKNILLKSLLFFLLTSEILYSQKDSSKDTANNTPNNTPNNTIEPVDTTDFRESLQEEILLDNINPDEEDPKLFDFLDELKRNPYDLNKVTADELETIPFLNSILAKEIIKYRNEIRVFKSKRGLLKVKGITEDLYEKIKLYLIVRKSTKDILIDETGRNISDNRQNITAKLKVRLRSRFLQDLQPRAGFLSGKYEGTRPKIYNQLNSYYASPDYKLEVNLTVEKDAGEKKLNDFLSGFIELKDYKFIKDLIAGDYTLNFAQGISMWSSQSFSKGTNAVNPLKKKGKGVDGYGSVNEVQYFRGGAVSMEFKKFNLDFFYSNNFYDASYDTITQETKSFYFDGYHRTSSEMNRMKSTGEKLSGVRLAFVNGNMRIGSTYWSSKFSKPVVHDSLKELFNFSGTSANMFGLDYDFIYKNINFYGEWARSQSKSIAGISAMQITFFKFADVLISYRQYPEDFAPLHSSAFGEKSGDSKNENGFYAGMTMKPFRGLIFNCYFDQYKFPYRTYFNPVPTSGNDFLAHAEWKAGKGLTLYLKYKNENKEQTRTATDDYGRVEKRIDNRNQLNVRAGFVYQLTEQFRFRSRYEFVNIDYKSFGGNNKGYLFFSDMRIIPAEGLVMDARYIFFDTDDYDSRIYEFESDILGVMSNAALYGRGRRWYLLIKYKPLSYFEIAAKYSETFIDGAKSIGSGYDEIKGDINNRLSAGVEVRF